MKVETLHHTKTQIVTTETIVIRVALGAMGYEFVDEMATLPEGAKLVEISHPDRRMRWEDFKFEVRHP